MGTYLTRTPSSAGNRGIWTVSCWVKKSNPTHRTVLFGTPGSDNNSTMSFIFHQDSGVRFGVNTFNVFTTTNTFVMRDPSSWYHLVLSIDTSQGSSDNRTKFYINGERFTNFDGNNLNSITNGFQYGWNNTILHTLGAENAGSPADFMDGYITNFVNIDGQALGPSSFGETDSTTGEWKPKADLSGLTFGTNGFWQKYESAGNLGLDSSGNSNTYTVNNAGTNAKTVDTASNNFCTFNALDKASNVTLSKGNLIAAIAGAGQTRSVASTMAISKGKWYWEVYYTADLVSGFVGLVSADIGWSVNSTAYPSSGVNDNVGYNDGGTKYINGSGSSYGASWASGDTISVAVDLDNNTTIFYKNGASQGSISKTFTGSYYPVVQHQSSNGTSNFHLNTGNPAYSITSGNADANGHGNFEYAVPSGYYALCTKNINQYG
jgi:hypothetical protein